MGDAAAMAVSGTVPARARPALDPLRVARALRRATMLLGIGAGTWFFVRFGSAWVPPGMDTVPGAPPGSWCIVDRFAGGLRVGSDVFVDSPAGRLLSRVSSLDGELVRVQHPNDASSWPDSRSFGPLRRDQVAATVLVVFPAAEAAPRGR